TWDLHGGLHGGHKQWLMLRDTVTDGKGEFHFQAWGPLARPRLTALWSDQPWLLLFKPRYKPPQRADEHGGVGSVRKSYWSAKDVPMTQFKGLQNDYATELDHFAADLDLRFFRTCDWEKLPRFLGAIYRDSVELRDKGLQGAPDLDRLWGAAA